MSAAATSWFDAWVEAATGPGGFWPSTVPGRHFATAAGSGPELAEAVQVLLHSFPEIATVVDVGAGEGALLNALAAAGADVALVGADLRPRPAGLAPPVQWVHDCWDVRAGRWSGGLPGLLGALAAPALLLATEWLDDLPCRIGVGSAADHHELMADATPGPRLSAEDRAWAERWWPEAGLVEVGLSRDRAWSGLVAALAPAGGLALAVDYGHLLPARPGGGSLAGFRGGRPAVAAPGRRTNLTAAVAFDSLAAAGEAAGASTLWCRRQADALAELLSPHGSDDALAELAARSRRTALDRPRDWGAQWWLLQRVRPKPL